MEIFSTYTSALEQLQQLYASHPQAYLADDRLRDSVMSESRRVLAETLRLLESRRVLAETLRLLE